MYMIGAKRGAGAIKERDCPPRGWLGKDAVPCSLHAAGEVAFVVQGFEPAFCRAAESLVWSHSGQAFYDTA